MSSVETRRPDATTGAGLATAQDAKPNNYFDGLAVTGAHKVIFFIIMTAYFFEQMDNWNFGFIAPAIFNSWGLSPAESNAAMSHILFWYFIGMTSGGFLGGLISDFIGRRKTFLCSMALFSVCSVINGLPMDNLALFIVARSLTGFGVFCLMVCSQAYIAEMAPAESRGKWQGLVAAVGFCAVPFIAFICRLVTPLSPEAWRWIFYFGGMGLLGFFIAHKRLKESPRWLVSRQRLPEAEKIVREITGQNIILAEAAGKVVPRSGVTETLYGMFARRYIGRTLLLMLLFVCLTPASFTFTGWTGKLLSSIPVIDPVTGLTAIDPAGEGLMVYDQAAMLTIMTIISCGVPAGCWLASLMADKGGRKLPIAAALTLSAISACLFARVAGHFHLAALCGFALSMFSLAANFMLFSYTAESYPTHMRNTAIGAHNGLARLSVSGFQYAIPVILAAFGGTAGLISYDIPAILYPCALLFVLPVPFLLLFGRRTGGKPLEDAS
ncbi:MAG: MFS transporter [Deltaproteobacteria bacterium]|jgi:putative MFS transporter|nr:MFS transporter [Deltaproteobacteria bacterium]